jgi:hypothetical protein
MHLTRVKGIPLKNACRSMGVREERGRQLLAHADRTLERMAPDIARSETVR